MLSISNSFAGMLPMKSLIIPIDTAENTEVAVNKVRVAVLTRGYAYHPQKPGKGKMYILKSEYDVTVLLNTNTKNKFVEVVFYQLKDDGFDAFAEKEFLELKSMIVESLPGFKIES
tara:strand:- start:19957 stop:20304 length:348 start_codon:yes stop_codon:yes gene_type:complete